MALVSKTFSEIITFTRASTGSYFDSAGVLQSAAINSPRLDYNPSTLAAQGLLIEEQRTNSIRNNTMVGAVAGTPGTDPTNWNNTIFAGITQQIVATGIENGITYIEYRFSGTATGSVVIRPDAETQVVASSGQAWTGSSYVRLVGGSLTNVTCELNMRQGTAAGALVLNTQVAFTPTSAALNTQRVINAVASMQPTTERILNRIVLLASGAIDITLRIGLPQLELGAFATSVIPTTTAAVTRAADVASVNTLTPWYNATEGTLYAEFLRNTTPAASTFPTIYGIDDGSINNRLSLSTNSARNLRGQVAIAGVFTTISTANNYTEGVASKLALGYKTLDHAVVANGGAAATNTTVTVPSGLTTLRLGDQAGGFANVNGYLRRITYYPRKLSNAELQAITA